LRLQSRDFDDGGAIPSRFTCDGEGISPQLSWTDVPAGVRSFALSVEDPDASMGTFIHWLVYDIPKDITGIEQGGFPRGARQVRNDFGKEGYGGPSPPSGTHRYIFTIHALDIEHLVGVDRKNFFKIVGQHTLAKAKLTGLYRRR